MQYYVYILASKRNGTLYVGMTNNLERRVIEHKAGQGQFTSKYAVNRLVYFEETNEPLFAIAREKEIKGWLRIKKLRLIEGTNPDWKDLLLDSSLRSE